MESKNYTVMELAEQIGVPRTTINDWLARYSMYIDTVAQGKRKVYPETALAVLREVASLRSAGKAFSEIETELAAKISDTVLLINDGRCEAIGTPDSLLSRDRLREHFDLSAELADKYLG